MVAAAKMIRPESTCDICGCAFTEGDKAICIVRVPSADFDTICVGDWDAIMQAAEAWLKNYGRASYTDAETLQEALGALQNHEIDP